MAVPTGWGEETRKYVEDRITANIQAFQVTYEQHVQTLIQNAINSVKAYFDSAVQAMNARADQVGRSAMQNEGNLNIQVARIDDALARLTKVESALTTSFTAPSSRIGTTIRRDNIVSTKELKSVANFGAKNGPAYQDWVSDVKTATEQVDELMVHVIEWVDGQSTLEDVTDAEFHRWANGSGHNQLDLEWTLKQLYYLMNVKMVEGAKDIVRAEASKGNIRGARAWKRVQVYAAGLTQNRRAELQSELNNFKRAASFDDLVIVLPKWECKVRDLERFPQSGVTDEVKMDLLLKIIPTSLQQFTSALISAGGYNYEKLRYFVDSQVAQNRTAKSYDKGTKSDLKDSSGMIIGEVSTEQTTEENTQDSNSGSNGGVGCDPWKDWKDYGTSEGSDGGEMYRMGKGGRYFNGTCDNCHQHGHAWRYCPKMSEQDKIALAAKKGVNYKGAPKGGGKDQGGKWGGNGGKGWDYGKGFGNQQWGKGWQFGGNRPYGKGFGKKGLNEMGGNGWDSGDVWDLNGIHLLTTGPRVIPHDNQMESQASVQAKPTVPVQWRPISTHNSFSALQEAECDEDNFEPDESMMHNQFPSMLESIRALGERTSDVRRSMPRAKFPRKNQFKAKGSVPADTVKANAAMEDKLKPEQSEFKYWRTSLFESQVYRDVLRDLDGRRSCHLGQGKEKVDDVMRLSRAPAEVEQVNSVGAIHFLGNLLPTEHGIHQVQAAPGFVWKPVTSIVDSGAINNVAPSSVSAKALVESNGSLNGMTYHTADGTRIPNLGQKTLETVSDDGSTKLSQTFQIADISRPLTSVGELADAGNLVVFGRRGGFIVNPDTGRRLNFQREHGVYLLKTWSQEPVDSTSVFSRQG